MQLARFYAVAAFVAALVMPRASWGQDAGPPSTGVITVGPLVSRFLPDGTPVLPRQAAQNPNDINYKDCVDDIVLQFSLTESGYATSPPDRLEIWAGSNCNDPAARGFGSTGPFCWSLAPPVQPEAAQQVNIYARDLTQYVDQPLSAVPNGGNAPAAGSAPGESACRTQQSPGQVPMNIYFMFMQGNETVDAFTAYAFNVDLVGPVAPSALSAGIGDGILLLNWTPAVDPTIAGFKVFVVDQGPTGDAGTEAGGPLLATPVYCRDPGDSGIYSLVSDAGALASQTDAGLEALGCYRGARRYELDSGGPGAAACVSSVLVDTFTTTGVASPQDAGAMLDGALPTIVNTFDAGTAPVSVTVGISQLDGGIEVPGATAASKTLDSVINGHQYVIAVAAFDNDGNVGALSNLTCATPEPVVDFWNQYGGAGGLSGGGCSVGPGTGSWVGIAVAGIVVAWRRRRRR